MKLWIKILSVFLFFSLIFLPKNIEARSGCCSHHGGVCGCGCCDGTSLSSTCAPYYPECGGYSGYQPPPSCPSMSRYNSISGQCECYSGYVASGNSCISADQACKNKYGYNSQSNYSGQCECRYGYTWNSSGTSCIDEDQACQNQFGYNSKATISGGKCECKYGYTWNKASNKCITKDSACQELNGVMSRSNLSGGCECLSGYEYDGSECVYIKKNIETKYTENKVDTTKTIIIKKEISPTPTLADISPMPSFEPAIKETNSDSHFDPIGNFFSKLFSWFFN